MKKEPEWIDIVALFALHGLLASAKSNKMDYAEMSQHAYTCAGEMIEAKRIYHREGDSDECE